nr:hypothetical protein [Tanacetum cinerariifolium]GEX48531.1 hypothetical protein [Tanacetum cinerariifolium]
MRMRYVKQLKVKMKKSLIKNKEDKKIQKEERNYNCKGKKMRKIKEEEDMESNEQDGGSNNENEMLFEAKKEARPAIKSWNTMMIRKRIKMETRQNCLGSLEHYRDFNPEEEQIGIDLYKGLDVYIEPLSDRILVTRAKQWRMETRKVKMKIKRTKEGGTEAKDDGDDNVKDKDGIEAKDDRYEVKDNVTNENDFENLLGDDTKDEVSMDIDIPNEEMKQKEANKEKVSDKNGNESKKEKQYEADKVEKVQEIQEEHNLTQDQFWDLTDKQYEELEIQATKDIKKKQTTKKKSIVDMIPPSFSLGLSPTKNEPKSKNKEERVKKEENVEKRAKKPSRFLVSPYLNKKTSIKEKTTSDEVTMT